MINWTKYFDKIWCINYLPYKERYHSIQQEFDRIGISSHPNFEWLITFDSPWYDFMFNHLINDGKARLLNKNELKCALAHYSCIKKSNILNAEKVLIIEDDSRFLRDLSMIENILDNIPESGDIILFDYFISCTDQEFMKYKNNKINDYFGKFEKLNSTGCYSLSKKALNVFQQLYEQFLIPADNYFSTLKFKNLNKCFSLTHMSCQATYNKSMSFSNAGVNTIHNVYKKENLNYDDYMMRNDGSHYSYGDFIYEAN